MTTTDFNYSNIIVDGKELEIDLEDEFYIDDLDNSMNTIASKIAFWGSVLASAEEEKVRVDAYYRRWRAQHGEKLLESDPKLAEWKVKQKTDSMEQFLVLKEGIAKSTKNALLAKAFFEAFCRKSNMLQSKGAMLRHELNADNMSVRVDNEEKREKVKEIFKKKSKKKRS